MGRIFQEDGAAVGLDEGSRLVVQCPGEGSFHVPEEFRGGQLLGDGAAVDGDEGAVGALAELVDAVGHIFLACPAGTIDEDGHVGGGHQFDVVVEMAGGIAFPFQKVGKGGRGIGAGCRGRSGRGIQRFTDFLQQFIGIDGLGHVVAGSQLHGLHGGLDVGIARHDDEGDGQLLLGQPAQQVGAVVVGQAQVGQDQIHLLCLNVLAGTGHIAGRSHGESLLSQPRFQHHAVRDIVFYD